MAERVQRDAGTFSQQNSALWRSHFVCGVKGKLSRPEAGSRQLLIRGPELRYLRDQDTPKEASGAVSAWVRNLEE